MPIQYFGYKFMIHPSLEPEAIHPSLWRASQLARGSTRCIDTGYTMLSARLPGGGWPTGTLTELLLQQSGIGEMRLLAPALAGIASRRVVMLEPPHPPQTIALAALGLAPDHLIWLRSNRTADALWAAEQVLRSGSCGALLFWQAHMRTESLRRLHLAAQHGETLCFMFRPLATAQDASAAPLRLSLRPANGGIDIGFIKRRGPCTGETLFLPLSVPGVSRLIPQPHVPFRIPTSEPAVTRSLLPEVGG